MEDGMMKRVREDMVYLNHKIHLLSDVKMLTLLRNAKEKDYPDFKR